MQDNKEFNELDYREHITTADIQALSPNKVTDDLVRTVTVGGNVKLLIIPLAATLNRQPIYTATVISHKPQTEYRETFGQIDRKRQVIKHQPQQHKSTPYENIQLFARLLATLPDDLPGAGFEVPSQKIANNASKFLKAMEVQSIPCPERGDVMPSAFGTVVIDINTSRGLVSIEIGRTKVGFFTDFEDGVNEESDGISTDFSSIPQPLLKLLLDRD